MSSTPIHADHLSSGRALAEAGAEYVLFEKAEAAAPFHGVRDGGTLELGNVKVEALHTPGHTPEHVCLAGDRPNPQPRAVVHCHRPYPDGGDVGRTELASAAEQGRASSFRACGG
jgi:glyoxylase-like metal-dependent hydrolase (beta-lactamase superfamily II)